MAAVATQQASRNHIGLGLGLSRRHDSHTSSVDEQSIRYFPASYPRPQSSSAQIPPSVRDSIKAQKMLGLVSEVPTSSRRNTLNLEAPSNSGIIKAQRTLGMVVDQRPRDRRSCRAEVGGAEYQDSLEEKLRQAEKDVRRLSGMGALSWDGDNESIHTGAARGHMRLPSTSTRGWIDIGFEEQDEELAEVPSRISALPPQLELPPLLPPSPLFSASRTISPSPEPVELDAITTRHICRAATHSRQSSCTSSRFHDRPTSRIASSRSRGLRSNTCPNFSRPLSAIALKPIPGEDMERDPLYLRYSKEPPTPTSPEIKSPFAFDNIKEARAHVEEELKKALECGSIKPRLSFEQQREQQRPKKARWSSLPVSLIKMAKRGSKGEDSLSAHSHGNGSMEKKDKKGKKGKANLTTENLQKWEDEVGYAPKMYRLGYDLLKSPMEMDMEVERGTPSLRRMIPAVNASPSMRTSTPTPTPLPTPNLHSLTITPPASPPLAQSSFRPQNPYQRQRPMHLYAHAHASPHSFTRRAPPSPLLTPPLTYPSPAHSPTTSIPTLANQKEIAAESRSASTTLFTCFMCKEAEHPSTFPSRRITERCVHPTRTCLDCLRGWIVENVPEAQQGMVDVGLRGARCRCPECGEPMREGDLRAFVGGIVG
ncbi:hypothetical protein CC80DRAFT_490244 [Byssothecium circinans]|uniref:Uncharacterized protein n=1 Tax=Byssothecium circinans TaxID=147558 RepID=A0A6A5UDU9_9PLEO|nr:hypothetical protein CC80DRAFT_490244 [Byssothecium circinans]